VTGLLALAASYKSVAIVGLAKNTGKTVTVNYLVAGATQFGVKLGLTSTGRDGETADILSAMPKPSVYLPENAVLATAKGSLTKGSARLEILEVTGISNTLGEIVIARVRDAGTVEISGPERTQDLREVSGRLEKLVDLVVIDGALDRIAASAPSITGAAILATGTVLGPDVKTVVQSTVHSAKVLMCPALERPPAVATELIESGESAVINGKGSLKILPLLTMVNAPLEILDFLDDSYNCLLVGGALTDELAELLLLASRRIQGLQVFVRDGTRIFVEPMRWQRLLRTGTSVYVLEPINLVAITVNPIDPRGRQLSSQHLVCALKELLPELLILDPLAEGGI